MNGRPALDKNLDSKTFRDYYRSNRCRLFVQI